jgi:hypothetical protein
MVTRVLRLGSAVLALTFVLQLAISGPAAADALRMYIENKSAETLYFSADAEVDNYPATIDPGTTSADIRADGENKGSVGQITYMNNQEKAASTCFVTLEFSWIFNSGSNSCDDKNFTIVNTGECTLAKAGTCGGAGDCNCHFTFSSE